MSHLHLRLPAAAAVAIAMAISPYAPARATSSPPMPPGADGYLGGAPAGTAPGGPFSIDSSGTSQNGWPANSDKTLIGVKKYTVSGGTATLEVKSGDVATVLMYVAGRFQAEIENLDPSQTYGYNYRTIAGSSTLSNHASGTAIDLNSAVHPSGSSGTFSSSQLTTVRNILAACHGVVRWGGDYNSTVDEMHWEINVSPSDSALPNLATELRGAAAPSPGKTDNGVVHTDSANRLVWYRSFFDGVTHGSTVVYGSAGDTPVTGDWNAL